MNVTANQRSRLDVARESFCGHLGVFGRDRTQRFSLTYLGIEFALPDYNCKYATNTATATTTSTTGSERRRQMRATKCKKRFQKKNLSAIPLIQKTPRHLGKSSPVIFGAVQPRSLSFCENLEDSMQRQKSLDDCNLRSVPIQAFGVDAQVQISQATG